MDESKKCISLGEILEKYEATPWTSLNRYIGALTGTAVGLFILSVGSLTVPRRLAPRAFLAVLLIFQIFILIPYFLLDSRRKSMILKDYTNVAHLKKDADECNLMDIFHEERNFYRFKGNGSSGWFEGFALIASSCISGVLASRLVYLSVVRSFDMESSEDGYGRRRTRGGSERNNADIDALLLELRYKASPSALPPDPDEELQCAICLDEIILNAPKTLGENGDRGHENNNHFISQLRCSHMYHENCLRNWFCSSRTREYSCPMCKASVWADGDDNNAEEVEEMNGVEERGSSGEGSGDIETDTPVSAIDIEIEVEAPTPPDIVALTSAAAEGGITYTQTQELESDDFVVIPLPRDGPQ